MREVYRKFGRVMRWENGVEIDVTESGEAIETADTFIATPIPAEDRRLACPDLPDIGQARAPILHGTVERLILIHGIAIHQFNDIEWREETKRLHVALTHNRIRVIIDLDDFDFDLVRHIADRLQHATSEREAPKRIRIAPHVARAIEISSPAAGGRDGKGQLIEEGRSTYWYRPSYRVRPILKALSKCENTEVDQSLPQAIAIVDGNRLLIDDGDSVYPAPRQTAR